MQNIASSALALAIIAASSAGGAAQAANVNVITACSKYGSNCVTAKVRLTKLGPQYRSPGGNWIWCEYDCVDTLRRDTVDFWDDQRERAK